MEQRYNRKSPAVKRLMREARELSEPTEQYYAQPLEDNLFEWHFTIRGPQDTEFAGGIYHGRIVLPPEYPMKPPSIIILTPNGRFEIFKKICLSISGHHPESWQPSWSIRTALLAIIGFMPTHGNGAIGSLDYTAEERKKLSKMSQDWKCPECGSVQNMLLAVTEASEATRQEAKELAQQINFQAEKEKPKADDCASPAPTSTSPAPVAPVPGSASASPPGSPPAAWAGQMPAGMPPFMPMMPPGTWPPTSSASGPAPRMPPPMMMSQMMAMMNAQAAAGGRAPPRFPNFPQFPPNMRFPGWPPNMPVPGMGPIPPGQGAVPKHPVAAAPSAITSTPVATNPTSNTTPQTAARPVTSTVTTPSTSTNLPTPATTPAVPTPTPTPAPTPAVTSSSELRQRLAQAVTGAQAQPQPARRRPNQSHSVVGTIFMVVIGLLFLLLLLRRLHMMDIIKLEQDADDI